MAVYQGNHWTAIDQTTAQRLMGAPKTAGGFIALQGPRLIDCGWEVMRYRQRLADLQRERQYGTTGPLLDDLASTREVIEQLTRHRVPGTTDGSPEDGAWETRFLRVADEPIDGDLLVMVVPDGRFDDDGVSIPESLAAELTPLLEDAGYTIPQSAASEAK